MKSIGVEQLNAYIELIRQYGYDTPLAISGPEQSGKSSLAGQCIMAKKKMKSTDVGRFQTFMERNTIFHGSEIWKLKKLKETDDVWVDEAIRVAWRREFYRPENRWLIKLFRQIGQFKRTYYLNIPRFWSLDEELITDRIKVWVHIIKKDVSFVNGIPVPSKFHAVVFKRDYHAYQDDPWFVRTARKQLRNENKNRSIIELIPRDVMSVLNRYVRLPSFHAYLKFDPMPEQIWTTYKKYSTIQKMARERGIKSDEISKWQLRFFTMLYNLSEKYNIPQQQLSELTTLKDTPLLDQTWFSKYWEDVEYIIEHPEDVQEYSKWRYKKKRQDHKDKLNAMDETTENAGDNTKKKRDPPGPRPPARARPSGKKKSLISLKLS